QQAQFARPSRAIIGNDWVFLARETAMDRALSMSLTDREVTNCHRCRRDLCWNLIGAVSDRMRIRGQAARSIGLSASFWVRLCHPSMSNSAEAEPGISAQSGPTPAVEERSSPESMEGTRARRAVPSQATERRAWGGAVDPRGRSAMGSDRGVRCGF